MPSPLKIGPRLRAVRKSQKISLRALAQRTGFSPSFVSQVELGQTSPSLASLQRICDALHLELSELLREPERPRATPVLRRRDRESLRSEWSKATAASLVPSGSDDRFSALLLTLDPGGRTGAISRRRGALEFAYCIRGRVTLILGEERHEMASGDSALLQHPTASWDNTGRTHAEVLVVSARPV
jgi:XRE family transcriptional regulator, regulator of sulfur utilization